MDFNLYNFIITNQKRYFILILSIDVTFLLYLDCFHSKNYFLWVKVVYIYVTLNSCLIINSKKIILALLLAFLTSMKMHYLKRNSNFKFDENLNFIIVIVVVTMIDFNLN